MPVTTWSLWRDHRTGSSTSCRCTPGAAPIGLPPSTIAIRTAGSLSRSRRAAIEPMIPLPTISTSVWRVVPVTSKTPVLWWPKSVVRSAGRGARAEQFGVHAVEGQLDRADQGRVATEPGGPQFDGGGAGLAQCRAHAGQQHVG